jgi:hypothetical protein
MIYVAMFDFALAGLALVAFGIFISSGIAFYRERFRHPVSEQSQITVARSKESTLTAKRSA